MVEIRDQSVGEHGFAVIAAIKTHPGNKAFVLPRKEDINDFFGA